MKMEERFMLNQKILDVVGETLRDARKKQCLSLRRLSVISGVSKSTIQRVETGGDCGIDSLAAICKALGLDHDDVVMQAVNECQDREHEVKYWDLINLYNTLAPDQQVSVINLMRSMVNR